MFEHSEVMRKVRSAVARTAHRWRKRLKVKQLRIDSLEESNRLARDEIARLCAEVRQLRSERAVIGQLRASVLETRTHAERAWR